MDSPGSLCVLQSYRQFKLGILFRVYPHHKLPCASFFFQVENKYRRAIDFLFSGRKFHNVKATRLFFGFLTFSTA